MNPQDPLAQLHPLREPALIGWWPPAPGWWIVAGLVVVLIGLSAYLFWRKHRRDAYRRAAQSKLRQIRRDFSDNGDTSLCLARVNALLKGVALNAYPRKEVASATGSRWLEIINNELPPDRQLSPDYIAGLYGADGKHATIENTLAAASTWIKCHKGHQS